MKFIVCVKQVPDVASPLQLADGEIRAEAGRQVMNAYDASALEGALVLTERYGGDVRVVLVGPAGAGETIRKALAMGAESAVHLRIEDVQALDAWACATILADHLSGATYDAIFCGKQAQDTDAGLTGPMLAQLLELPCSVNAVDLDIEGGEVIVTRQGDAGREVAALRPPCLVTCSNDMNDPRIPNLKGIMAAKRKPVDTSTVAVPAGLPSVRLRRYEDVPPREPGRVLEGDLDDVVRELVEILRDEESVL